ncbi:MAG: queuosine precursor transporter [Succinivibrionaceae bacterium]|nr:queuosine precursor transporter [Succinivibrionaceae bacterium]
MLIAFACLLQVTIIVLANYAVQFPITVLGLNTTPGTFIFPLGFVATDLTVRLIGARTARRVVYWTLAPALLATYALGTLFERGEFMGLGALADFNMFTFRIALASLCSFALGQMTDILVFARLRRLPQWWPAPAASTIAGNLLDSLVFFSVAFCNGPDPFMAEHWLEIGAVAYVTKVIVGTSLFLPVYGALLMALTRLFGRRVVAVPA